MALGRHWEWRGFGTISDAFIARYGALSYEFGPQVVEDIYIWAPDIAVNLKIREGEEGGLKFKHPCGRDGRFGCWVEDPEDLHTFPLSSRAWDSLAAELASSGVVLGPYPHDAPNHDQLLFLLERAGCRTLLVTKERGARWWQGPNGRVLVGWTEIRGPQSLLSISLESEDLSAEGEGLTEDKAKADLQAAYETFELDREELLAMNYLQAVVIWLDGLKID